MTTLIVLGIIGIVGGAWCLLHPMKEYVCRDCGETTFAPYAKKPGNTWFTAALFVIGLFFWPLLLAWIGYMAWRSQNTIRICPNCDSPRMRPVAKRAA